MHRYAEILGATPLGVVAKQPAALTAPQDSHDLKHALIGFGVGVAGAVVGNRLWKDHRWLGTFSGFSAGLGSYNLVTGRPVTGAFTLGAVAASVGVSKVWKKHPVWGWILGGIPVSVAGAVVIVKTGHK